MAHDSPVTPVDTTYERPPICTPGEHLWSCYCGSPLAGHPIDHHPTDVGCDVCQRTAEQIEAEQSDPELTGAETVALIEHQYRQHLVDSIPALVELWEEIQVPETPELAHEMGEMLREVTLRISLAASMLDGLKAHHPDADWPVPTTDRTPSFLTVPTEPFNNLLAAGPWDHNGACRFCGGHQNDDQDSGGWVGHRPGCHWTVLMDRWFPLCLPDKHDFICGCGDDADHCHDGSHAGMPWGCSECRRTIDQMPDWALPNGGGQ